MQYFTKEEARRILNNCAVGLILPNDDNPCKAVIELLLEKSRVNANDVFWVACTGFLLGKAVGIHEERLRRKAVQA